MGFLKLLRKGGLGVLEAGDLRTRLGSGILDLGLEMGGLCCESCYVLVFVFEFFGEGDDLGFCVEVDCIITALGLEELLRGLCKFMF